MKTLLPVIVSELAAGRAAALATVVRSSGSVPRGAGACMLLTQSGATGGTVGGGVLEHRAELELTALLSQPDAHTAAPTAATDLAPVPMAYALSIPCQGLPS